MKDLFIIRNAIKCLKCGEVIESFSRHDFKTHECNNNFMINDGGLEYIHRSINDGKFEDLTVYSDAPFEVIRDNLNRGTSDKKGNRIYKKLSEMSNKHIEACIVYNTERGFGNDYITEFYRQEVEYRKLNNILIEDLI